jgi:hypothetical protein
MELLLLFMIRRVWTQDAQQDDSEGEVKAAQSVAASDFVTLSQSPSGPLQKGSSLLDSSQDSLVANRFGEAPASTSSVKLQTAIVALWEELCVPLWHRAAFVRANPSGNDASLWESDLHCRIELARLRLMQQTVSASLIDWYVVTSLKVFGFWGACMLFVELKLYLLSELGGSSKMKWDCSRVVRATNEWPLKTML